MVRLYCYEAYRWNLINNIVDDIYQAITNFYYGTEMNEQYGEIKEISKEMDADWRDVLPPNTENAYLLKTETKTLVFITSLLSEREMEKYLREEHKL